MSLDKPTEEEAEAMLRLQSYPEFTTFLGMLGKDMENLNARLILADIDQREANVLIGQLRFGSRLTDAVANCKHTLQRHRQPKT